jgi:hypothetical protein
LNCHCGATLTGETAIIGEPMCAANGYPDDYLVLASCSTCSATHSIRMWQSEAGALESVELDRMREEGGVVELIGDSVIATNGLRDLRRHDYLDEENWVA